MACRVYVMLGTYYFISREAMAFGIAEVNSRRACFAAMIVKECKKIQEAEATKQQWDISTLYLPFIICCHYIMMWIYGMTLHFSLFQHCDVYIWDDIFHFWCIYTGLSIRKIINKSTECCLLWVDFCLISPSSCLISPYHVSLHSESCLTTCKSMSHRVIHLRIMSHRVSYKVIHLIIMSHYS